MSLWAFRFLLWYICVLLVQPQNRFTFLWPLRIANLSFLIATGLHILSCLEAQKPLLRLGPATLMAFALLFFATLSQHFGVYQISPAWNTYLDIIVKNSLLLIMVSDGYFDPAGLGGANNVPVLHALVDQRWLTTVRHGRDLFRGSFDGGSSFHDRESQWIRLYDVRVFAALFVCIPAGAAQMGEMVFLGLCVSRRVDYF